MIHAAKNFFSYFFIMCTRISIKINARIVKDIVLFRYIIAKKEFCASDDIKRLSKK
jgi:hypothetical protein